MANCLVTGASGFIGTHLVRRLVERGDRVKCLVRFTSPRAAFEALPVELAYGDLSDPDSLHAAVDGCDYVYHLAGLAKSLTPGQLFNVNERGAAHLLSACAARTTPPTVVLVSSLAAAGPSVDGKPREPGDPPQPVSYYGRSKLAGEQAARKFSGRVPLTIARPPIVIGEGDRASLEMFHSVKVFRAHLVPGRRDERFSFIHVADLTDALALAAERGERIVPGDEDGVGMYYPAATEMPTYADVGRMIAKAIRRKRCIVLYTPIPLVWGIAALHELGGQIRRKPATLNFDKVREATAGSWICSSQKAIEQLGFQPAAPLAERIRQTADWYLRHGWL